MSGYELIDLLLCIQVYKVLAKVLGNLKYETNKNDEEKWASLFPGGVILKCEKCLARHGKLGNLADK